MKNNQKRNQKLSPSHNLLHQLRKRVFSNQNYCKDSKEGRSYTQPSQHSLNQSKKQKNQSNSSPNSSLALFGKNDQVMDLMMCKSVSVAVPDDSRSPSAVPAIASLQGSQSVS